MRTWLIISLMSCFLAAGTIVLPVLYGQTTAASVEGQPRLDELLEQRRKALAQVVDIRRQQHNDGSCTLQEVLAAQMHLLEAALDAAKTHKDRVVVLKKQLELAGRSVSVAEQMASSGRVTQVTVLQARASQLSVEIELLREQNAVAPNE